MKILFILLLLNISTNSFAEFLPTSFTANFSQEYLSSLKGKVKKGTGSIEYKFPGNIRFETTSPTHVLFVTNGLKAWYYTYPFIETEAGELTEASSKEGSGLFSKFFDSLKNGLKSNAMYDVKKINEKYLVSFKEKASKEVGIKSATLTFEKEKEDFVYLQTIDLEFLDQKKSLMKLADIKINPQFTINHFIFVLPKKN